MVLESDGIAENLVIALAERETLFAERFLYRYARESGLREILFDSERGCQAPHLLERGRVQSGPKFLNLHILERKQRTERLGKERGFALGANDAYWYQTELGVFWIAKAAKKLSSIGVELRWLTPQK